MGKIGGSAITDKKIAASKENGKKGGRPKIISITGMGCDAMKDGKMYHLMIVNDKKFVQEGITTKVVHIKYRLVVCPPGGQQYNAEYQPEPGVYPDIEELAEKNGFETIDIRDFGKRI